MMMKVAGEAAGDVAADDEDGRLQASLVAVAIEAASGPVRAAKR